MAESTSPGSPPDSSSVSGVEGAAVPVDRRRRSSATTVLVAGELALGVGDDGLGRRRPPASACVSASRAATTSPCCACSPACTSAARCCSSSRAPAVEHRRWCRPAGRSGRPRRGRERRPSTRAATAASDSRTPPSGVGCATGSAGASDHLCVSGRRSTARPGTDGVLTRAEPPGETRPFPRPGDGRHPSGRPGPPARHHKSVITPTYRPPRALSPTLLPRAARYEQVPIEELGTPLADVTFVVVDLETTGGSPKDSAITEIGAVKVRGGAGARRVPDAGRPGPRDPALHQRPDRDHLDDGRRGPADRRGAAGVPRVRPRRGAGRAQRAVRPRLPQGRVRRERHRAGRPRPPSTPPSSPAGCSPATRCPTASWPPSRRSSAPRRRPPTGRWTTPARPSTSCTGSSSGSGPLGITVARGADRADPPGRPGAPAQAAPGRRRAARARASTSSAARATSRSTSARRTTCAAGCAATSPPASSAAGSPRWSRCPSGSTRSRARTTSRPPSASCG